MMSVMTDIPRYPDRLPRVPIDWERMAQFAVAIVMVVAGAWLFLRGIERGGSATWGGTIVAALLVVGAIGLSIDRRA